MLPTALNVSPVDLTPSRLYRHDAFDLLYRWSVDSKEYPGHVIPIAVLNERSSCMMIGWNIFYIFMDITSLYPTAVSMMTLPRENTVL